MPAPDATARRVRLEELADRLGALPTPDAELAEDLGRLADLVGGYALSRAEAAPALVVAVAGPSGVGKSTVVNALAGAPVSPEGAIRPTTSLPVVVTGSHPPSPGRMARLDATHPGAAAAHAAPGRLEGITVVDLPADFDPAEAVMLADLVLVVVSPGRYADAAVWDAVAVLDAAEVPWWLVANRMAPELLEDLRRRLDGGPARSFPVEGRQGSEAAGTADLVAALDAAAEDGEWRRHHVERRLTLLADEVEAAAAALESRRAEADRLLTAAATHYGKVRDGLDEAVLDAAAGAGGDWPAVAGRLVSVVTHRVGSAAAATAAEWSQHPRGRSRLEGGGAGLWRHHPSTDLRLAEALREWWAGMDEEVAASLRRRPAPARLSRLATLVRRRALGGEDGASWLVRRRFRHGFDAAAGTARATLVSAITAVVDQDEERFAAALGPLPTAEELEALRAAASPLRGGGGAGGEDGGDA